MEEYKIYLGVLAVIIQLIGYTVYFTGILKGRTKPHAFTWLAWGIINIVAFLAVFFSGGAAGSWVLAVNIVACLSIASIGFWQKRVRYDLYDWMALAGALIGVILWQITDNALYAVVLVSLSDAVSAIPTLRKAYYLPFEENGLSFFIGILSYSTAILSLEVLSVTTWLYPATIIFVDSLLVILILLRRRIFTS